MDPKTALRRTELRRGKRDWYRIEDAAADEAAIYIYDEIGFWGTTAAEFVRDLAAVKAGRIVLHLNSPGGDVFDGIAIHTALRDHRGEVEVRVDGLAASIASVIAMAGDRVVMAKHSTMMIHEPWTIALGDAGEFRKQAEVLDGIGDTIAGVYAERAGGTAAEWRARMHAETWYSDREAVDAGLADEVAGDAEAASNSFDLTLFRNVPDRLRRDAHQDDRPPTKREVERALRDVGLSQAAAKALVAGWQPDPEPQEPARDVSDLAGLQALLAAARALNT